MKPAPQTQPVTCSTVHGLMPAISSKWAMHVVAALIERPRRFSELKRAVAEITQKSLTAALRELEKDGLVTRTVTPTIPPRVDYELTALGRSLLEPARAMATWAMAHQDEVRAARRRFADMG